MTGTREWRRSGVLENLLHCRRCLDLDACARDWADACRWAASGVAVLPACWIWMSPPTAVRSSS